MKKNQHFVRYHAHRFFKKTPTDDLNWWLIVTLVENKYCTEKDELCVKEMTGHRIKRVTFLLQAKQFIFPQNWPSRKALKCLLQNMYPAGNYMFKVNNRNTRTRREICLQLTIKIPERRQWRLSGIFNVNFEHIPHLVLVSLWAGKCRLGVVRFVIS